MSMDNRNKRLLTHSRSGSSDNTPSPDFYRKIEIFERKFDSLNRKNKSVSVKSQTINNKKRYKSAWNRLKLKKKPDDIKYRNKSGFIKYNEKLYQLIKKRNFKCPGGNKCLNFNLIKKLESEIVALNTSINELKKINEYLTFTLRQRDQMYKILLRENTNLKENQIIKKGSSFKELLSNTNYNNKINHKNYDDFFSDYNKNNYLQFNPNINNQQSRNEQIPINFYIKNSNQFKKSLDSKGTNRMIANKSSFIIERNPYLNEVPSDINNKIFNNILIDKNYNNQNKLSLDKIKKNKVIKDEIRIPNKEINILRYNMNDILGDSHKILENIRRQNEIKKNMGKNKDSILSRKSVEDHSNNKKRISLIESKKVFDNAINKISINSPYFDVNINRNSVEYLKILQYSKKKNFRSLNKNSKISFLSLTYARLTELLKNPQLKYYYSVSEDEDIFFTFLEQNIKNNSRKTIDNFSDFTNMMIKNYKNLLSLLLRIKQFMISSIDLVTSVLSSDATKVLMKNTCYILNCERCSLFIYDKATSQLVMYSSDSLKPGQIKVRKDQGIIGTVFLTGEKLKIDDAYQDPRFNKDVDLATGFTTKNILCFPLKDDSDNVFGVIQAINKKTKFFEGDDEELLYIFSKQASSILLSLMNKETSSLLISRLQKLITFSMNIWNIHNKKDFTNEIESLIDSIFSTSNCQFLFTNKNNKLFHYGKDIEFSRNNIGIIYYVFNSKVIHGCSKVNNSKYYNPLVDIPANENLVTVPIIIENKCVAIFQTSIIGELYENTGNPKEHEMILFSCLRDLVINWMNHNKQSD